MKRELRIVGRLAFCLWLMAGDGLNDTWPTWMRVIDLTVDVCAMFGAIVFAFQWLTLGEYEA